MAQHASPPSDLTVPDAWALTPGGMTCDGLHALDLWAGLDTEGRIVVGDRNDCAVIAPEPDDWTHSEIEWALCEIEARGGRLGALGREQLDTLRELLGELFELRRERFGSDEFDLAAAWEDYLAKTSRRGAVSGRDFVLGIPADPPALWGDGDRVAWARGEGLMLYAPQGVGKTSLAQQLVNARVGIGPAELLGLPVMPVDGKVLYLALDRPPQIARSWRRMVTEDDAEILRERVVVWQGPLPFRLSFDEPVRLTAWARDLGAGAIVVDSYKNLVPNLSSEESGVLIDSVMQEALAEGLDWLALHHPRKSNGDNRTPNTLDDVYGSTWLTAGIGSVIGLWGKAGDTLVSFTHLKQPAEPVGPLTVAHDHATGRSEALRVPLAADTARGAHERAIIDTFTRAGGPGTLLALSDFDIGVGDRTVRQALGALVDRGVLEVHGTTSDRRWTIRPAMQWGQA